jgi:hypothetical protein
LPAQEVSFRGLIWKNIFVDLPDVPSLCIEFFQFGPDDEAEWSISQRLVCAVSFLISYFLKFPPLIDMDPTLPEYHGHQK